MRTPATHALLLLLALATPALAQVPPLAPRQPVPELTTRLLVKVSFRSANGSVFPLTQGRVCVGDASNPSRFEALSSNSGEATFTGVPLFTDLLVTASGTFGGRTAGIRIEHRMHRALDVVEVLITTLGGPTCSTPGRSKPLPAGANLQPSLKATLRTSAGPFARERRLLLFTHRASPWNYLEVGGRPTHFRTGQSANLDGVTWRNASVTQGDRMHYVHHDIEGGDGRKTIYVQLRNSAGTSPVYSVQVDFVDLYRCQLEYERADNALAPMGDAQGDIGKETLTLLRAESKAFDTGWPSPNEKRPGFGMHLRRASNIGQKPVELTITYLLSTQKIVLEPGFRQDFQADLKAVRCP